MDIINIPSNTSAEQQILIDTSVSGTTYFGYSAPGIPTDKPFWKIMKMVETSILTTIKYADSNQLYDNVWDDRTSLTYG